MKAIDIDPDLERRSAAAAQHARAQMEFHVAAELRGDVPGLMESLSSVEKYAYTFMKEPPISPDGRVRIPIASDYPEIEEEYTLLHAVVDMHTAVPIVNIVGEFYSFAEVEGHNTDKRTGLTTNGLTIALFPCGTAKGITGELAWVQIPRRDLGLGCRDVAVQQVGPYTEAERLQFRKENFTRHNRYLQALRAGDVDAILDVVPEDAQAAVRDYVDESSLLTLLEGRGALRSHYELFFEKYEINSVDLIQRIAEDWYVFAETRTVVTVRTGPDAGRSMVYRTAEYMVPGYDGQFLVHLGTGTDLVYT